MQNNSLDTCRQKTVIRGIIRCISVKIGKNRRLSEKLKGDNATKRKDARYRSAKIGNSRHLSVHFGKNR